MFTKKVLLYLSVVYLLIVGVLMIVPIGNSSTKLNNIYVVAFRGDYIVHCMIYLPWMFVGKIIWSNNLNRVYWFLIGLVVAIGLELIQAPLSYRTFNINDLLAGVVGILLSLLVFLYFERKKV